MKTGEIIRAGERGGEGNATASADDGRTDGRTSLSDMIGLGVRRAVTRGQAACYVFSSAPATSLVSMDVVSTASPTTTTTTATTSSLPDR